MTVDAESVDGPACRGRGIQAAVAATALFGSGAVLVRLAEVPALPLTAYRLWLGVLVFFVAAMIKKQLPSIQTIKRAAPVGALFSLATLLLFAALSHLTVAETTIVAEAMKPIAVFALARVVLGERPTSATAAWSAVAVIGGVVMALGHRPENPTGAANVAGFALATGALLASGAVRVLTRRARAGEQSLPFTTAVLLTAAIVATPLLVVARTAPWEISTTSWLWLVMLAVVPGGIGYLLLIYALGHVDAGTVAVIEVGIPVVASLIALGALAEVPSPISALAGAVTVGATGLAVRSSQRGTFCRPFRSAPV